MTDAEEFKSLVENSSRILITSHISPDPDAICSVLLMGQTLEQNFPSKQLRLVLEEHPGEDFNFLTGFNTISFGPVLAATQLFKPDLIIIVDANSLNRVSRNEAAELENLAFGDLKAKIAVLDHHQAEGKIKANVYINDEKSSTAQQIYETCFDQLKLVKPDGYADTALLGILRDTARFKYDDPDHRNTFRVVSELLDAGASIEELEFKLDRYSKDELAVLAHLALNMTDSGDGYSYSFIDDDVSKAWTGDKMSLKAGCDIFSNKYLRNLEKNYWGFVIYPEPLSESPSYSVSFRSVTGEQDVAKIAAKLGGGGHVQAAGAKNIKAKNIAEAIEIVRNVIKESLAA